MKEKTKDLLMKIIVFFYTIVCDAVFVYSVIYCIQNRFDWYYIALIIIICSVVLYFFNVACVRFIKEAIKKRKQK